MQKPFLKLLVANLAIAGIYSSLAMAQVRVQKDISLSQKFGEIAVGDSAALHWNLRAKDVDLQIQSITLQGEGFILDTDCPEILPAKQKCKVGIIFAPQRPGPHQSLLVVDLFADRFVIQALGEGK